ncbi:glycosyltransferase [Rhabdothermincola sediminis]|uniref:glycosyltransferase n=1 Tax=Rhabdothermincola sediminis TaxID=2751370 RepID=UPI001AA02C08|nr:glycosyltransferase [Rhabdothermincola sediminis]
MSDRSRSLVAVMPRPRTAWPSAAGLWVTAAGWAAAGERCFGRGWVVTPDATASPEEAVGFATAHYTSATRSSPRDRLMPPVVRTAVKDTLQYRSIHRFAVGAGPWDSTPPALVWQHHEICHRAGIDLAQRAGCPAVVFVHAPQVWEARQWGVRRPGWGSLLERFGESPALRRADAVACVSEEVATLVVDLGADPGTVVVTPMAVDPERFHPRVSGKPVRDRYALGEAPVVGWCGNFRRFHGLEQAVEGFALVHRRQPDARLLLVGDGPERRRIEALVQQLGLGEATRFTGGVPHVEMAAHLAAMDVAWVLAQPGEAFHYSPHKMREYLACAVPVVAPSIGDVARVMHDGLDAVLYPPGDVGALAEATLELLADPDRRGRIGSAGRELMLREGTWDAQLAKVTTLLGIPRGAT